jgi:hypothetical protein
MLQEIKVYLTRKLNQKPVIMTFFSHTGQVDLNMSNLTDGFFDYSNRTKNLGSPKKLIKKSSICEYKNVNNK